MTSETLSPTRAARALQAALRNNFEIDLDERGYASRLEDVLLPGVEREDFERDLDDGAGKELEGKFLAAHSSSQLAVNALAPFRRRPHDLKIGPRSGWTSLRFEAKCRLWKNYTGTPAHLDALGTTRNGIVGIESKLIEYLKHTPARFRESYRRNITGERMQRTWFEELERLSADPHTYRHLDAAQLVKHAFGLDNEYPDGDVTLLYLYWEPANGDAFGEIALHRREIEDFADRVAGDRIRFDSMSYLTLWEQWSSSGIAWLEQHAAQLARRYKVDC